MALKANSRATDERKEAAAKVARREAKAAVEAGRREIREAEQAEACDTARFGHGCAICDEAAEEDEAEGFCPCGLALENGECPGAESALDGLVS